MYREFFLFAKFSNLLATGFVYICMYTQNIWASLSSAFVSSSLIPVFSTILLQCYIYCTMYNRILNLLTKPNHCVCKFFLVSFYSRLVFIDFGIPGPWYLFVITFRSYFADFITVFYTLILFLYWPLFVGHLALIGKFELYRWVMFLHENTGFLKHQRSFHLSFRIYIFYECVMMYNF